MFAEGTARVFFNPRRFFICPRAILQRGSSLLPRAFETMPYAAATAD